MNADGRQHGFTLIEVAIVIAILGLLVGLGAELFPLLIKQNKLHEARGDVSQAHCALIGYALATGRLPFASTDQSGNETNGRLSGYLPAATLGINGRDAHQQTLFYAVDGHLAVTTNQQEFKDHLAELISGAQAPDLFSDSIEAAFVVLSAGENRRADSPNDDNNNGRVDIHDNNVFARPGRPIDRTYDDILEAASNAYLLGRCN